jgi:hypothetical protein
MQAYRICEQNPITTAFSRTRHPGMFSAGIECLSLDHKTLDACAGMTAQ